MREHRLVIVGDEAYTAEEWSEEQRRRERRRERDRRRARQEQRREYLRSYMREYQRKQRAVAREAVWGGAVGALHSLACTGPHRRANRNCRPIPVYRDE